MKIVSRFFNGIAIAVLASGVLVAAESAIDTDAASTVTALVAEATVAVEPQVAADGATVTSESQAVTDVPVSGATSTVATVQPQVIDPADQANLAIYGMAVARCMIYEALQRHTPMGYDTAKGQALMKDILFYGGLMVCSLLASAADVGVLVGVASSRASIDGTFVVGAMLLFMPVLGSFLMAGALTKQACVAYQNERQAFLTEVELQALIKTFGSLKTNEFAESLTAVKKWFVTIQSNLCDLGYQKTLSLFDVQLHQIMVKVNDVLAEKALIDQKRHPTEQEVVEIQTKLAVALGAFAAYVLAVLNDKENYLKQAN
jgi:hypothetical protein